MSPDWPLEGSVVVVTGGGRGVGRAVACALGAAGAEVAICGRHQPELDEAAQAIHEAAQSRVDVLAVRCDVAREEDVSRFAAEVEGRLGACAILVNGAGQVGRGRLDTQTIEEWRGLFDVNLFGVYLMSRAFLPSMRRARRGRIVNVAAIAGQRGAALLSAYWAAKHAVIGLTRALAEELRDENIQVNAVCPGSPAASPTATSSTAPEDVARVVRFLAVEAPPALTGSCLEVTG